MKRVLLSIVLLTGLAMAQTAPVLAAVISPNAMLPNGLPGFDLVGIPPGPPTMPQVFQVGFNANPTLPPGPPVVPGLDLADVLLPAISNPGAGSSFSFYWGMTPAAGTDGISFADYAQPPTSAENRDGTWTSAGSFTASDGSNQFTILYMLTGATALDPASWVIRPPGPPNLPAVQFDFMAASAPVLSFSVTQNGAPLSFATVPAPPALLLLGSGLAGLLGMARRKAPGA